MSGPKDEKSRDRFQRISTEAQYMAALVSDLLDLGKIEAGLDPPREPIDVVPLVAEAVEIMRAQADGKAVPIALELPADAWVSAAPARLKQALLNLVGNAVKYTPGGGRVTVSVDAPGRTVTIRVADTGIGIPARHLPHVFDKFYRVHDASTKGIPGTGLGLAITKSIVESHGGTIRVESTEGAGSVFLVELPARRPA
jgi:signal transduction histidine kinase